MDLRELIIRGYGWYAVAYHGTNGLDSHGYTEVFRSGLRPDADQTTTVAGPFSSEDDACKASREMQARMDAYAD